MTREIATNGSRPGRRPAWSGALLLLGGLALLGCAPDKAPMPEVTAANVSGPPAPAPAPEPEVNMVSASGRYLAGRHARRTRDFGHAAEFLSEALSIDKSNRRIRREAFFALVAAGRMKEAADAARAIVADNEGAAVANLAIVVDDMAAGRFDAAAERLSSMPRRGMNTFTAPLLLAWAEAARGDVPAAVAALDGLRKVSSFAALRNLHLGLIHAAAGHAAEAEAALAAAVEGKPSLRVVQAYGRFLERHGRAGEAKALYEEFLGRNPESDSIEAAEARVEQGRAPAPLVANAREGVAEVFFNLAGTLAQGRSADLSLVYGRFALYLRPRFPVARLMIAGLLENLDRGAEAVEMYDTVDAGSPLNWSARLRKTAVLDDLGRTEEAIAELRAMAAERPGGPDASIRLGDLFRAKERFEEAFTAYSEAIERAGPLAPHHWSLLYARGIAYERAGRWQEAEDDFLRALELSPEQPYVLNYLGYSWVDKGLHLERARDMIKRAVERRPNDGYIVDSLGWVLYRLKDFGGAVEQLERAVVLRPEDPTINDHLGDAYWRVGRVLEARFQWRRALSLDPEKTMIPAIQRKLRRGLADSSGTDEHG